MATYMLLELGPTRYYLNVSCIINFNTSVRKEGNKSHGRQKKRQRCAIGGVDR